MEESVTEVEYLTSRVEQLQRERDALKKDVEQLCLQQAGPGYLAAATRIHFHRTAGLEQEIDSLNKKLAGCIREKQNLQEELSEAYRIKSQLADLHAAEVLKNMEAEKQLNFFQSSVAAAFSERDQALMESEKAKEKEEAASERLTSVENRILELQSAYHEEKKINADLQKQLKELKEQNEAFEKVINKFNDIFQIETGSCEDDMWQEKCSKLLKTSPDNWTFKSDSETSTSKYIVYFRTLTLFLKFRFNDQCLSALEFLCPVGYGYMSLTILIECIQDHRRFIYFNQIEILLHVRFTGCVEHIGFICIQNPQTQRISINLQ